MKNKIVCNLIKSASPCEGKQMIIKNYFVVKQKDTNDYHLYACEKHAKERMDINPFLQFKYK